LQLAIQIFSIKMIGVGAVRSGMVRQDNTSDGAHNAVTQLTMMFAIPRRDGNGQFCFLPRGKPLTFYRKEANRPDILQVRFSFNKRSKLKTEE
jgi:hypothetical protein